MGRLKLAAEFAPGSDNVQAMDTGKVMKRLEAIAEGYEVYVSPATVAAETTAARADGPGIKLRSWRSAIMTSPEAKNRDDATVELITSHSPETLSVDDARAFLRGLPTEQPERTTSNVTTNLKPDPRAARIAEIQGSMKSYNNDQGYRSPRQPVAAVPSLAGVDSVKLKRLAEIRIALLDGNPTQAARSETNSLRYALSVHDTTGAPLPDVFARLGVDTSKFIR